METINLELNIDQLRIKLAMVRDTDLLYDSLVSKGSDHEDVKDERIPYWADLWPSAIAMAEHLVKYGIIRKNMVVHEMGCGLGLPGIVAGMSGAKVIFSDYLSEALAFAETNWKLNCEGEAEFRTMDWRDPDPTLKADLLLASDVAYERRSFKYLPEAFKALTHPGSTILGTEPKRLYAKEFFDGLTLQGFSMTNDIREIKFKGHSYSINVYEIVRR